MARPVDFTPAASQPTAVAVPEGQGSFAGAGTDALTKDTGRFELAGDTVAPGTRTPFGEGTGPGSRSVAEAVTGFDPAWGEPPETVQGGLLKWNPTRLIYELRPGAAPPYGSKQRYLYDELARLEAQGVFIQPYVNELVPDTWRFRWVRVPTDSPEVGKAYKDIGPLKEHYVGAAIELARHPREVPETPEVPEIAGPALPTALDGGEEPGIEIAGETPPTVLHGDEPEIPEFSGEAVTTILQDVGDPLFGYQDDDKYKPGPKQFQMSDYAWLTQEDLPSGCAYPYALMPVPIADYESGAWLEPDYEPSIPLPEPYPVWQCGRIGPELVPHKTVGEGSVGKVFGLGPKFGLTPPPPPTPEPPPPLEQVEIDIPMHSITRELFPKTEAEVRLPEDVKTPDLALSELSAPRFGWLPDDDYTPPSKPIDPKKFAWIPQHEMPVGCPYPHLFMPVPLQDFHSGMWLQPGYVPSTQLPEPHDEIHWQCGFLPTVPTGRGKGGGKYRGIEFEPPPPPPPKTKWEEAVDSDPRVKRLRRKRERIKRRIESRRETLSDDSRSAQDKEVARQQIRSLKRQLDVVKTDIGVAARRVVERVDRQELSRLKGEAQELAGKLRATSDPKRRAKLEASYKANREERDLLQFEIKLYEWSKKLSSLDPMSLAIADEYLSRAFPQALPKALGVPSKSPGIAGAPGGKQGPAPGGNAEDKATQLRAVEARILALVEQKPRSREEAGRRSDEIIRLKTKRDRLRGTGYVAGGGPAPTPPTPSPVQQPKPGPTLIDRTANLDPCADAAEKLRTLATRIAAAYAKADAAAVALGAAASTSAKLEKGRGGRTDQARKMRGKRSDSGRARYAGLYDSRISGSPIHSAAQRIGDRWMLPFHNRAAEVNGAVAGFLSDLERLLQAGSALPGECQELLQEVDRLAAKTEHIEVAAEMIDAFSANEILAQEVLEYSGPAGNYRVSFGDVAYRRLAMSNEALRLQLDKILGSAFFAQLDGRNWESARTELTHDELYVQGALQGAANEFSRVSDAAVELDKRVRGAFSILTQAAYLVPGVNLGALGKLLGRLRLPAPLRKLLGEISKRPPSGLRWDGKPGRWSDALPKRMYAVPTRRVRPPRKIAKERRWKGDDDDLSGSTGRSLGAASSGIPIAGSEWFILPNQKWTPAIPFLWGRRIRIVDDLVKKYGGTPKGWRMYKKALWVESSLSGEKKLAEIHFFKHHGLAPVEPHFPGGVDP